MSQPERSQEELNNMYAIALAQVGERNFKIRAIEQEVEQIMKHIDSLQKEASELQAKKKLESEELSQTPKVEEVSAGDVLPISE